MANAELTRWVCNERARLVLTCAAWRPRAVLPELGRLPEWIARGYAGEMSYLPDPRRADPQLVLEGSTEHDRRCAQLQCAATIFDRARGGEPTTNRRAAGFRATPGATTITKCSEKSSMRLLWKCAAQCPEPFEARVYVDTGPIIERVAAKYAGLGWLAKNTCLINQQVGSWLFLGVAVTTLALEPTCLPANRHRPICAGAARGVSMRARRRLFPKPTSSMRVVAFPTSRLSCAARFPKNFARPWARQPSAAISARMFAPGIVKRR